MDTSHMGGEPEFNLLPPTATDLKHLVDSFPALVDDMTDLSNSSLDHIFALLLSIEACAHELFAQELAQGQSLKPLNESQSETDATIDSISENNLKTATAVAVHQVACVLVDTLWKKFGWALTKPFLSHMYAHERKPLNRFSLFHYYLLDHVVVQMRLDADALFTQNLQAISCLANFLPKERGHYQELVYFLAPAFVGQGKCTGAKMRRYLKHYRQFVGACKNALKKAENENENDKSVAQAVVQSLVVADAGVADAGVADAGVVADAVKTEASALVDDDDMHDEVFIEENDHLHYFSVDVSKSKSNGSVGFFAKCLKWITG